MNSLPDGRLLSMCDRRSMTVSVFVCLSFGALKQFNGRTPLADEFCIYFASTQDTLILNRKAQRKLSISSFSIGNRNMEFIFIFYR